MTHITVPDESPFLEVAVTTAQTDFTFTFTYFDATDIRVTVGSVELAQDAFEVNGTAGFEGGYPGGTVVLDSAVANTTVRIWSEMPPVRTGDFTEGAGFSARSVNTEVDRLTARQRDMRLRMERTPVLAFGTNKTLADTDAGQIFTNEGMTGSLTYTLPNPSAGLSYSFAVVAAYALVINAGSYTITDGAGGSPSTLTNSTVGSYIEIRGMDGFWTRAGTPSGTWS